MEAVGANTAEKDDRDDGALVWDKSWLAHASKPREVTSLAAHTFQSYTIQLS